MDEQQFVEKKNLTTELYEKYSEKMTNTVKLFYEHFTDET